MINSSTRLKSIYSLRSFLLLLTMIISLFLSYVLLTLFPKWTLFAALPFVEDLFLEFYLLGDNISVSDNSLVIVVLGLPLWFLFIITAADSAGVVLIVIYTIGSLSFVGGIK